MKSQNLMKGEYIIKKTNHNSLLLTNYRIKFDLNDAYQSMMLEKLSMVETLKKSYNLWIILALLSVAGAVYSGQGSEVMLVGVALALLFLFLYVKTGKTIIKLTSDGNASIDLDIYGRKIEIFEFIEAVEIAKEAKRQNVTYKSLLGNEKMIDTKEKRSSGGNRTKSIPVQLSDKDLFE